MEKQISKNRKYRNEFTVIYMYKVQECAKTTGKHPPVKG
jgi:hypothetical protein